MSDVRTGAIVASISEIYAARLYTRVGDRLGLDTWKANVNSSN